MLTHINWRREYQELGNYNSTCSALRIFPSRIISVKLRSSLHFFHLSRDCFVLVSIIISVYLYSSVSSSCQQTCVILLIQSWKKLPSSSKDSGAQMSEVLHKPPQWSEPSSVSSFKMSAGQHHHWFTATLSSCSPNRCYIRWNRRTVASAVLQNQVYYWCISSIFEL